MGLKSAIFSLIISLSCIVTLAAAESYTLTAYSPATRAIHGKPINARGRRFIIGLDAPMTYCPDVAHGSCPPGNTTTVDGLLTGMMVMVPGGQLIYVDPDGFVGFTQAHSASVPANSTMMKGFHRTTAKPSSPCDAEPPKDLLDFCDPKNAASEGVYACPYPDLAGTWVLVAGSARARARRGDCQRLEGLEMHESEVEIGAWQYT
ncbi:IgE-binding protein [Colletotrichum kahawae]|uniref:IgE-binding protein n=1 Tax=Colletotrichum kahawae TaxID=34407 RepID=A0AAD9YM10_COLKA|nr:IgE-binding protein [Colletotrichum kahawae]